MCYLTKKHKKNCEWGNERNWHKEEIEKETIQTNRTKKEARIEYKSQWLFWVSLEYWFIFMHKFWVKCALGIASNTITSDIIRCTCMYSYTKIIVNSHIDCEKHSKMVWILNYLLKWQNEDDSAKSKRSKLNKTNARETNKWINEFACI